LEIYLKLSLKIFKKLAGLPVFYSGSNESYLAPSSNGWTIPLMNEGVHQQE
jgi:hypothetical protein